VIVREMLTQLPTACNKVCNWNRRWVWIGVGGSGEVVKPSARSGWGEGGRKGGGEVHRWLNPLLLAEPT